jgi:hypothetical protein
MWVPRTPRRPDFCGCPPCPLCFDWAEDNRIESGMTKYIRDILGADRQSTAQEKKTLDDVAEKIHAANLARPQQIEEQVREQQEAQNTRWCAVGIAQLAKTRRIEAARPKPAPRAVTCDDIDVEKKIADLEAEEKEPAPLYGFGTIGAGSIVEMYEQELKKQTVTRQLMMTKAKEQLAQNILQEMWPVGGGKR